MRIVFVATLVLYTLNLVARSLHFFAWPLPLWLEHAIDALLTANVQMFLLEGFLGPYVITLCGLVILASFRWAFFANRFFRCAGFALLILGILPLNVWLDGAPEGLAVYGLIVLLLCPLPIPDLRTRRAVRVCTLALFLVVQTVLTAQLGDAPFIAIASVIGLCMLIGHERGWTAPKLYFSATSTLVLLTIATTVLPQSILEPTLVADRRVVLSSSGEAYSFCYSPDTRQLFAGINPPRSGGRRSHLERIDLSHGDSASVTEIEVFADADPILRQIECDAGKVYFSDKRDAGHRGVGVASAATGELLTRSLFDEEAGNTFVHVTERGRMFFFPEAGDSFVEYEATSGQHVVRSFDAAAHPLFVFLPLPFASFLTNLQAYSLARHAIYVNHFLSGSEISEIDYDDARPLRTLRTYNGLNHSLIVDRQYDRLIVSGLWGVEFMDLASGAIVQRHRTEFDARAAVIDDANDLVYVPTHFGRYLYTFDRRSMRFLGKLLVGSGARNCILTDAYLVLSSRNAVYGLRREDLRRWAREAASRSADATQAGPRSTERKERS